ncbi:MAG: SLC13 family permease [candidate division KSB1 bacterium]|nr:SLC13 family permease [candidate division KSB1 bacterium]MDZ7368846.1 SLC13 family permease [candidate division KSB1 bacterium]MDZ7407422.1 SLC13 family permease [candidate division KSB1 bacterium]
MPSEPHPSHHADSGYDAAGLEFSLRRKIGLLLGVPFFLFLLWPALTPGLSDAGRRLLATSGLMAFWWITEAIPIPATALLPMCLYPLLSIMPMAEVTRNYGDENIFLFLGGFLIAIAMQKWHLHRRLALHIVRLIGAAPRRLVLGFMCATAFLSMWISNTATTMMMYPIALAVILQLTTNNNQQSVTPTGAASDQHPATRDFRTCLMLAIAYAASIGGLGTLIGTPPNIIFAGSVQKLFPQAPPVDFLRWLAFGLPLILVFIPITWFLLTRLLFPIAKDLFSGGQDLIEAEIKKLGRMSAGERRVLVIFLATALAWIFRVDLELGFVTIPGWASRLGLADKISDATVAMIAGTALFFIPVRFRHGEFLLDWATAVKIPWGILLLFGGGIAMSAGFKSTGLSVWLGERLAGFGEWPPLAMILTVTALVIFLTEVTSNTATATIFMPIMAATAQALHFHPFLLMIPAAVAASCAFMLPVATPPNAIVFASGYVTVPQMARAGFCLNLIAVALITTMAYLLVAPVFRIDFFSLPAWLR